MKKSKKIVLSLILLLFIPILCFAQIKTTIKELLLNPFKYSTKFVQVEGKVIFVKECSLTLTDGENTMLVLIEGCHIKVKEGDYVKVTGIFHGGLSSYIETSEKYVEKIPRNTQVKSF